MQSKIEQQVMASVGTVYAVRQLFSATAIKLYICALSLYGLAQLVWVNRVWENLARVGWENAGEFLVAAVLNTELLVQLALAALVVGAVGFLRDVLRTNHPSPAF